MLANIIIKPGKIELFEIKTPETYEGEILVKVEASLTCGTDLKAFLRGHPLIPMPGVFGHEFSGTVAGVGKGVRRFKKGDEIMGVHTAPCLECTFCKKGLYNLCENIMHTKVLGAFAEYILLPSHIVRQNTFHKPKNLLFEEAAFLEPLSCVVHSVEPLGIKRGDSVLIIGAGPIGLLHLLLLKRKKAKVAVADIKNERLRLAKRLGADLIFRTKRLPLPTTACPRVSLRGARFLTCHCEADEVSRSNLNAGSEQAPQSSESIENKEIATLPSVTRNDKNESLESPSMEGRITPPHPPVSPLGCESYRLTKGARLPSVGQGLRGVQRGGWGGGGGFDYVFECTGKPEIWEASVNYVRRGGTVILFGGCESGTTVTYDTGRIHYDEITLKGVFHYMPSEVKKAYKLLCEGKLGVKRLISGRYPLTHTQKVFDKLSKGIGIKYAIIP